VSLRVAHRAPGRVRLWSQALADDAGRLERLAGLLAAAPQVSRVQARPATGSLIVFHHGAWEPVAALLAEATGAAVEEPPPREPPDLFDALAAAGERLDARARRATAGRADLDQMVFVLLALMGMVQLGRGRIAGPALTLFSQAISILVASRAARRA